MINNYVAADAVCGLEYASICLTTSARAGGMRSKLWILGTLASAVIVLLLHSVDAPRAGNLRQDIPQPGPPGSHPPSMNSRTFPQVHDFPTTGSAQGSHGRTSPASSRQANESEQTTTTTDSEPWGGDDLPGLPPRNTHGEPPAEDGQTVGGPLRECCASEPPTPPDPLISCLPTPSPEMQEARECPGSDR